MNKVHYALLLFLVVWSSQAIPDVARAAGAISFVVQLTRPADNYGHRRVMLQIDRTLNDLGPDKVHFIVVAYEEGIHALLADNPQTSQLLVKLANRGVEFRACRISMHGWNLKEEQFPMEVEFIAAGAPEMIRLQTLGYKYWRP